MYAGRTFVSTLLTFALLAGCGGAQKPTGEHKRRPVAEPRAVKLIAEVFRAEKVPAESGRSMVVGGKPLAIDVGAKGRLYGVAYITGQERKELGPALPSRPPGSEESLQLVRGTGEQAEARVLVLRDRDYMYDDHLGASHEDTALTAERKLRRDVRDFLVNARAKDWP